MNMSIEWISQSKQESRLTSGHFHITRPSVLTINISVSHGFAFVLLSLHKVYAKIDFGHFHPFQFSPFYFRLFPTRFFSSVTINFQPQKCERKWRKAKCLWAWNHAISGHCFLLLLLLWEIGQKERWELSINGFTVDPFRNDNTQKMAEKDFFGNYLKQRVITWNSFKGPFTIHLKVSLKNEFFWFCTVPII